MRRLIDALHHDSGVVPINLSPLERIRAHAALVAHHVRVAEDLPALVEIEEETRAEALVFDPVIPSADPRRIDVAEHRLWTADWRAVLREQISGGVAQEGVTRELPVWLSDRCRNRRAPLSSEHNRRQSRGERDHVALVARVVEAARPVETVVRAQRCDGERCLEPLVRDLARIDRLREVAGGRWDNEVQNLVLRLLAVIARVQRDPAVDEGELGTQLGTCRLLWLER